MTGLGHNLADLLDGYPATAVKGLVAASNLRRRRLLSEQVAAMSVAVTGALDLALNQGKGKVLERWFHEVQPDGPEQKRKPRISERAFSFFGSLPRRQAKG